ncbi:hypothetical protein FOA52_009816 [Chlamydomonas sp. UWO 241]|nr:hypothetical protein FOA52_009816 [Chlamydomonas sp. UWO 241]
MAAMPAMQRSAARVCSPAEHARMLPLAPPTTRSVCIVARSAAGVASTNGAAAAPAPIIVNVPEPKPAVLPPAASYANMATLGGAKAAMPARKTFVLGIMAGAYVAFGSFLMLAVGGAMPGLMATNPGLWKLTYGLVFPFGLGMVLLGGGELYTGNTLFITSALIEKKCTLADLAKNWSCSYAGNMVGSLAMVAAVLGSGVMAGNMMPVNVATAKATLPFAVAITRAILANWLVCIAVKQAAAASTLPGKMLAIWPPITAFVVLGLEHSVANMFTVPLGIALGAKVTMADFVINNLIPVTIGNTIAGVVCMAFVYAVTFGAWQQK